MPPRALFRQADFLYDMEWTSVIDNMFIELLANEAKLGNFRVGGDNTHTLEILRWTINNHFNVSFTFEQIYAKVHLLRKRYHVFYEVVHMSGIHYDMRTNTIVGEPFVWQRICREYHLAHAYMTLGDPNWTDLCAIFGGDDEFVEMNPEVEVNANDIIHISSDDSEEENREYFLNDVINISSDDGSSSDNSFWNELMEQYAADSADEVYTPPMSSVSPDQSGDSAVSVLPGSTASNSPNFG